MMTTILQNSFDGVDENWTPDLNWDTDCDKKCLEKAKRMADKDKCKSQNLRKRYLKKPVINMRLEAPFPDDDGFGNLKKLVNMNEMRLNI